MRPATKVGKEIINKLIFCNIHYQMKTGLPVCRS
jgi:hypothetical protein